ncbi:hypothetical protein CDAR_587661 [Caerostris darwini]|uniref:Secreted protein n=1 Tax=Caerostris darwini TaxID=1538125 RepID=A0AAV4SMQ7_9ARAC|nr:hypothetical protein CDAR_587661 [Caerostris darwini]
MASFEVLICLLFLAHQVAMMTKRTSPITMPKIGVNYRLLSRLNLAPNLSTEITVTLLTSLSGRPFMHYKPTGATTNSLTPLRDAKVPERVS